MKQLMENFRAFIKEAEASEKSDSYAKIYNDLNLPNYLGNATIGSAGFRIRYFAMENSSNTTRLNM